MELKFIGTGADAAVVTRSGLFITYLFTTEIFKNGWPEEKLGSQSVLQQSHNWYKQSFEVGLTGHHGMIDARRNARQALLQRIQKILRYLEIMADESDISILLNAGAIVRTSRKTARKAVKATP